MSIEAVIWDFGGVIVRTMDQSSRELLAADLRVSLDHLYYLVFSSSAGKRTQLGEISPEELWESVRLALKLDTADMSSVQERFWAGDEVDYELVEYIRSLRSRVTTALLSNAWKDMRSALDETWKIGDIFDYKVISGELGIAKPDPRIYQIALEQVGYPPEQTVFIDDFPKNIAAAEVAGMNAILFQSPGQVRVELEKYLQDI
jgi:epoxide hydrolase-like predicted phosphatase